MKRIAYIKISVILSFGAFAASAEEGISRSIDITMGISIPYKDDFGSIGIAYMPSISYDFILSEDNLLGITLLKFSHHFEKPQALLVFGYGFFFRHYLPKSWLDIGALVPYVSYGILLNQGIIPGSPGRGIAHNTCISTGTDIVLAANHRLLVDATWSIADFPGFGQPESKNLNCISASLGYRLLF